LSPKIENLSEDLKLAIHQVVARAFDKIEEDTGGEIVVEDLTVKGFSISVSVTLRPREPGEPKRVKEAEK